jgi:hypothetical protein
MTKKERHGVDAVDVRIMIWSTVRREARGRSQATPMTRLTRVAMAPTVSEMPSR